VRLRLLIGGPAAKRLIADADTHHVIAIEADLARQRDHQGKLR
jgi:hypothetical protein